MSAVILAVFRYFNPVENWSRIQPNNLGFCSGAQHSESAPSGDNHIEFIFQK
jgi:hypothetical protein